MLLDAVERRRVEMRCRRPQRFQKLLWALGPLLDHIAHGTTALVAPSARLGPLAPVLPAAIVDLACDRRVDTVLPDTASRAFTPRWKAADLHRLRAAETVFTTFPRPLVAAACALDVACILDHAWERLEASEPPAPDTHSSRSP